MFFLKALFCRTFQTAFRIALSILPYREPKIVGSCSELGEVLKSENVKSVLIVTDEGIVKNGLTEPFEEALSKSGIKFAVYDKTKPNPTTDNVENALKLYRKNDCSGLIAIGGGSSMDCAKVLGARLAYPKKSIGQMKGILRIRRKLPPLIAVPTTAGTGSEVTLAAIITDAEERRKYALMSFPLIPKYAVLDAALTYSLPPHLTFTTETVVPYTARFTILPTKR